MFQSPLAQPGSIEEGSFKDSYFCFSFLVLQTTQRLSKLPADLEHKG